MTGRHEQRAALGGTARVFAAEALILPTGLVTAAFLTRWLGSADYGLFTLVATFVAWMEWSVGAVFARATLKFVGEAEDWRPLAATIVRLQLIAGIVCAVAIALLATPLARLFGEPSIAGELRLLSLDVPLFCVAQAMRNILVAIGRYRARAAASAGRAIARMVGMLALVAAGLGVRGAVIALLLASLVDLAIAWWALRPPFGGRSATPARVFAGYLAPLFLAAMSTRLLDKLDLMALKALGGSASDAGYYGAAQNLALAPSLFALAFTSILLATLSRMRARGDGDGARAFARLALRIGLLLFPVAAVASGTAPGLVSLIFGEQFRPAAAVFAPLIYASVGLVMSTIASTMVIAADRPNLAFALAGPLLPIALAGHLVAVPRWGAVGAASVTTAVAAIAAIGGVVAVGRIWRVAPPLDTALRSLAACLVVHAAAKAWLAEGLLVAVEIPALLALAALVLVALRELDDSERRVLGRWVTARLAWSAR